ncbi:D-alanyl-D-alanine carboxypeptidase precursor [Rubripirellula tenax]|uniref:D-alanyl-D-alanine carboxypeptidase n=1 Tax=Rubripirellula tenax TaxID=2528015 RepID=A0A5C6EI07_9BACT|nr:serine hydrolase [Rubripirellula tenax]TWU47266.1 D-alanyl-D-alanine carboxypeptidase precursor [Rubripirellula tenax]
MKFASSYTEAIRLVVSFVVAGVCSASIADEQTKVVTAKLAEICRKHDVPAMSVAIVSADGLVNSACFGDRKRGTSDKVEMSDRFPLGSCTKSMTSTVAAAVVEAGKIDWDTTISEVWPQATDDLIHPKLRDVTLNELLSHQSGMAGDISEVSKQAWGSFFAEKQSPVLERRRMLKLVLAKVPVHPRGSFAYSNMGYAIASAMIETRAQESFESLTKKHIFDPLRMHSADFRSMKSAAQLQSPLLWGHRADGTPVDPRTVGAENPTVYAACGTVNVTIEDYAKYAQWHLGGKPTPVLRTQEAYDHLHAPQVDHTNPGTKYACGWLSLDTGLGPALTHAGSNTNSFAVIWVLPQSNFAAVVCTNSGQAQAFPACDEMMSHLMMELSSANKAEPPVDPKAITPDRLVGRYQLTPSFIFDVKLDDGHLMVGITNQPTQEVFADSSTMWSYRGIDAKLEFRVRAKGPAYELTLHQNGLAQKARRIRE